MDKNKSFLLLICLSIIGLISSFYSVSSVVGAPKVIDLTQTGCQFLEPEKTDHKFKTTKSSDCKNINKKTSKNRFKTIKPLKLKSGDYIFKVKNKNVSYPLGFWIRGTGFGRISLPSTSGGGITTGRTKEYKITLKKGSYVYSCPLNPTPDYPIIVTD